MHQPYTDAEVNAAIAATIAEMQQKVDAANARVAELERENKRLTQSLEKVLGKKSTLITSKLP